MKRFFTTFFVFTLLLLSAPISAQSGTFSVHDFSNRQDGLDQVFTFSVQNDVGRDINVSGRLIVLNVYDTSPPASLPINSIGIQDTESLKTSIRWSNAPLIGQVRALLVLNVGPGMTIVDSFEFWVFPWQAFIVLSGIFLVMIGLILALLKLVRSKKRKPSIAGPGSEKSDTLKPVSKKKKPEKVQKKKVKPAKKRRHLPSGMTGYIVEFGDTVVTVANRFDVTWEDVVRANRLRPPYAIKVGAEILIPIHELHRPEDTETQEED